MQIADLEALIPGPVQRIQPISQGAGGTVYRVSLPGKADIVAKARHSDAIDLRVEAKMLSLLQEAGLPTPEVIAATEQILCMSLIKTDHRQRQDVEKHAADLLLSLHTKVQPQGRFGLDDSNYLGLLHQPNQWCDNWIDFFVTQRIEPRLKEANHLPRRLKDAVRVLLTRLGDYLPQKPTSSLIHGDIWGGNVLTCGGRVAAFIDPAPYYGDREMELAFITMFHTFGDTFFDRYHDSCPISPEFWSVRRHVYNLYPILTHCVLFPGQYEGQLASVLQTIR